MDIYPLFKSHTVSRFQRVFFSLLLIPLLAAFAPPFTQALQQNSYNVGPYDILEISVWGQSDLNKTVTVSMEGSINFPLLGDIFVSGMSVKQIEVKMEEMLARDYLVDPQVFVNIKEYNSQKAIVLGEVNNPGVYVINKPITLLELISKAGGVTERVGKRIIIFRGAGETFANTKLTEITEEIINSENPLIVDVNNLLKKGGLDDNITIISGDVVFLEAIKDININEQRVYISGEVEKPGAYEYQNGLTALNLCIIAGGFDGVPALNRATVNRKINDKQEVFKIDLNEIIEGAVDDFLLMPGDRLNIPESFW